jgi:hypothetical protein
MPCSRGTGSVKMQLTGTDFEFVDSVALLESKNSERAVPLEFTLPQGKEQGEQAKMQTDRYGRTCTGSLLTRN